jgi:hypothetical protein
MTRQRPDRGAIGRFDRCYMPPTHAPSEARGEDPTRAPRPPRRDSVGGLGRGHRLLILGRHRLRLDPRLGHRLVELGGLHLLGILARVCLILSASCWVIFRIAMRSRRPTSRRRPAGVAGGAGSSVASRVVAASLPPSFDLDGPIDSVLVEGRRDRRAGPFSVNAFSGRRHWPVAMTMSCWWIGVGVNSRP